MTTFWDERFTQEKNIYGANPNAFYQLILDQFDGPKKILFPGEGQGRNAIYEATKGHNVVAFDSSHVACSDTLQLANSLHLPIDYTVASYDQYPIIEESFDAIVFIFTHVHESQREAIHRRFLPALKPGGSIIAQYFSKEQLSYNTGGPKQAELLYRYRDIEKDFHPLTPRIFNKEIIELNEGNYHQGKASVISYWSTKE